MPHAGEVTSSKTSFDCFFGSAEGDYSDFGAMFESTTENQNVVVISVEKGLPQMLQLEPKRQLTVRLQPFTNSRLWGKVFRRQNNCPLNGVPTTAFEQGDVTKPLIVVTSRGRPGLRKPFISDVTAQIIETRQNPT